MRSEHVYALATRAVQALTMAVAGLLVAMRFSPDQQGLFFTFMSLGALIQLGEFGLGYAMLQTASHLAASGEAARLRALARSATRQALLQLVASASLCALAGVLLLSHRAGAEAAATGATLAPWLAYAAAVPVAHAVNLGLLFVEGARSVRQAWRLRLVQEALAGVTFLLALAAGAGLWALVVQALARAVLGATGLAWLAVRRPAPTHNVTADPFDWRLEAWPFQWRLGLSALAGFLVSQAFNPVLLLEQGSEAAGRFGFSLAIINMLLLVSGAWPLSQAARYGHWLATGEHVPLRQAFRRMLLGSTALTLALAVAWLGLQAVLTLVDHPLAQRMADLPTVVALIVAMLCQHITAAVAVLLRAQRREPLLGASIVGGVLTLAVVWWAAHQGGLLGPALAAAAMSLLGLAWVWWLYRRFVVQTWAGGLQPPAEEVR